MLSTMLLQLFYKLSGQQPVVPVCSRARAEGHDMLLYTYTFYYFVFAWPSLQCCSVVVISAAVIDLTTCGVSHSSVGA